MNHLDLFSGIGGFALAAQTVWGESHNVVAFCEIDKFCQFVLKKHWPNVPICEDIRKLTNEWIIANTKYDGQYGSPFPRSIKKTGNDNEEGQDEAGEFKRSYRPGICGDLCGEYQIDLLTDGFPCQPFSCAGRQRGNQDDRFLWPEMLRVIHETKPRWIIGENVPGIINLALDEVCTSLETEGYEVEPIIIPACGLNAPHRRDRVWIVAHCEYDGIYGTENIGKYYKNESEIQSRQKLPINEYEGVDCSRKAGFNRNVNRNTKYDACDSIRSGLSGDTRRRTGQEPEDGLSQCEQDAADTENANGRPGTKAEQGQSRVGRDRFTDNNPDVADTQDPRLEGRNTKGAGCSGRRNTEHLCGNSRRDEIESWSRPWLEVATELCRVDDGLPAELDGLKLSKSKHRENRLKALGNAIAWPISAEIMGFIKKIDDTLRS